MSRYRPDPCANCHHRERSGPLLCMTCRILADRLITETSGLDPILVSGSGPWDASPLPKPLRRFPGLSVPDGG